MFIMKNKERNNMNKKKFLKILTIIMAAMAIVAMSPVFVKANNHQDENWLFEVGSYGKSGLIVETGRNKTDSSSAYIYCINRYDYAGAKGTSFEATAYGSNSPKSGYFNCSYNGKSSKTYNVYSGSKYYMINYIYEAGYGYANIWYNAAYDANVMFRGVWSPDSI